MLHPRWRQQALASLGQPFDLVVLGGGITGCGIFLDAAQRGLRVLLVERGDIASGTSSRSSKLIHGGLRYLKRMQLRVTRHSCRERDRLLHLSPHLVQAIRFVYPAYHGDRVPGWSVGIGLWLYDRLTHRPEKHSQLTADELRELVPGLPTDDLDRALSYFDARVDDARLTFAVAATGFAYGGVLLTRADPEELVDDARGRLSAIRIRDLETGAVHQVATSLVINATGVWVDRLRHRFGRRGQRLRPSRGSHLLFPAERLPIRAAVTLPSPDDDRPVFFIPHPEGVLVGTTDLFYDGDLDDPRPSRAEVDYLLRAVAATFPGRPPGEDDMVGCFAGVRPVLDHHTDNPSHASREEGWWEEKGLLSVAGGKLTTWRSTAEEVVDAALELLPESRSDSVAPCATAGTALAGLAPADLDRDLAAVHGAEPRIAAALARRLGSVAWTACEMARDRRELRPLADGVDLCLAETRAHLRFGAVLHLSDLLLRRVRVGMWRPAVARELLPALREVVSSESGWTSRRWDEEVEHFGRELRGWTREGIEEIPAAARSAPELAPGRLAG